MNHKEDIMSTTNNTTNQNHNYTQEEINEIIDRELARELRNRAIGYTTGKYGAYAAHSTSTLLEIITKAVRTGEDYAVKGVSYVSSKVADKDFHRAASAGYGRTINSIDKRVEQLRTSTPDLELL